MLKKEQLTVESINDGISKTFSQAFRFLAHHELRKNRTFMLDLGVSILKKFLIDSRDYKVEVVQDFCSRSLTDEFKFKFTSQPIDSKSESDSASYIRNYLGPEGIKQFGGSNWWLYRKSPLKSWWIERRHHIRHNLKCDKVIFYVHGGAHYLSTVRTNAYHIQRHTAALGARTFAPDLRLAPQFPFPCSLHDVLSSYLYLLKSTKPENIIFMGDSSGAGLIVASLVLIRDSKLPLPAGVVYDSPWVDLTHSLPSVVADDAADYIPSEGFHHRASRYWPITNLDSFSTISEKELLNYSKKQELTNFIENSMRKKIQTIKNLIPVLQEMDKEHARIDFDNVDSRLDPNILTTFPFQVQFYTSNANLKHPLISPIFTENLGGLPPSLVLGGSGERLRDEIVYIAHKMNTDVYNGKRTKVRLEMYDDCCHVVTALPFVKEAGIMVRRAANFAYWCLKQHDSSFVSPNKHLDGNPSHANEDMVRLRISRNGEERLMEPKEEIQCLNLPKSALGTIQVKALIRWIDVELILLSKDTKKPARYFAEFKHADLNGYLVKPKEYTMEGENPPLSALVANCKISPEKKQ